MVWEYTGRRTETAAVLPRTDGRQGGQPICGAPPATQATVTGVDHQLAWLQWCVFSCCALPSLRLIHCSCWKTQRRKWTPSANAKTSSGNSRSPRRLAPNQDSARSAHESLQKLLRTLCPWRRCGHLTEHSFTVTFHPMTHAFPAADPSPCRWRVKVHARPGCLCHCARQPAPFENTHPSREHPSNHNTRAAPPQRTRALPPATPHAAASAHPAAIHSHSTRLSQEQDQGYLERVEGGDDAYATKDAREFATVRAPSHNSRRAAVSRKPHQALTVVPGMQPTRPSTHSLLLLLPAYPSQRWVTSAVVSHAHD